MESFDWLEKLFKQSLLNNSTFHLTFANLSLVKSTDKSKDVTKASLLLLEITKRPQCYDRDFINLRHHQDRLENSLKYDIAKLLV